MIIQQIRNATLKIQYGGFTILLDPWLQDKGVGFSAEPVKEEMIGVKNPMNDLPPSCLPWHAADQKSCCIFYDK